jgi:hypothetical protein
MQIPQVLLQPFGVLLAGLAVDARRPILTGETVGFPQ